ncbi:MAG: AAA family ATPase [Minicystis sp.]
MPAGTPPRTNVGARATCFIGREAELGALRARLSISPLVVVLGPPGVGKTRLAEELVLRDVATLPGGAWLADLTEATSVEGTCAALARALDVPLGSGDGAAQVALLGHALSARGRALVVLDNFEHLVALAPATLGPWLARAPEARFLVTSRERTGLEGEALLDLPPLRTTAAEGPVQVARAHVRSHVLQGPAEGAEAVALFLDRARRAGALLAATSDDAGVIAAIARELDGLPLAIELAAARLRVFSFAELLAAIRAHRLDVLVNGPRAAHGRHASLRAALESSWSGLDPAERAALAQGSLFRGGFDLRAAEGVLDLGEGGPPVADVLQALRDRSLIAREEERFRLYLGVRDFARAKLEEAGATAAAEARHAAYYLAEGSVMAARAEGPGQVEARRWLAAEVDNLLAVHRRALRRPEDPEHAALAALALQPLLTVRGPVSQAAALLDPVLAAPAGARLAPGLRARVLAARAEARRLLDQHEGCVADGEAALASATGDPQIEGAVLLTLAVSHSLRRGLDEARRLLGRITPEHGPVLRGRALAARGILALFAGAPAEAHALFRDARRVHAEVGDLRFDANTEANLGLAALHLGMLEEARRSGERAIALHRDVGSLRSIPMAYGVLCAAAIEQGRLDEAEALAEQAATMAGGIGLRLDRALHLAQGGIARFFAGRLPEARAAFELAARAFHGLSSPWEPDVHAWIAAVDAAEGRIDAAQVSLAEARRLEGRRAGAEGASAVDVLAGHLDLALAARAPAQVAQHRSHAALRSEARAGEPPSIELRLARRSLAHALEAAERGAPAPQLSIQPAGDWFQLPGGEVVGCARKRVLARILVALAQQRLAAPGEPLGAGALVAAAWPGERLPVRVTSPRIRVAISALRRLGLRDILQSHARGYLIDPHVAVRFAERPAEAPGRLVRRREGRLS